VDFTDPNLVLSAFVNDEADDHAPWRRVNDLNVFDVKIDIAVIVIKFDQLFFIFFENVVFEIAALGNPRQHPAFAGLTTLRSFFCLKAVAPNEIHFDDFNAWTFADHDVTLPGPRLPRSGFRWGDGFQAKEAAQGGKDPQTLDAVVDYPKRLFQRRRFSKKIKKSWSNFINDHGYIDLTSKTFKSLTRRHGA